MDVIDNSRFISFEGIDFSGKSTQISLLKSFLEESGQKVMVLREPGGTAISEQIRKILLDKKHLEMTDVSEMLLYSAARNQLVLEKVIPALLSGTFVIADRYVDSTTAYQGYGRGLPMDLIRLINKTVTNGVMPALTFYLAISEAEFLNRAGKLGQGTDRLENAGKKFFSQVRYGYTRIAETEPDRYRIIDGEQAVDVIQNEIRECVSQKLHFKKK